jgi:flagellin-like hook-associated protein FlgL
MDFGLSAGVRANLLALQRIASDIAITQQRLATGKRVNSAIDDPAAFFTASALSTRAAALNRVADDIGTAKQTLEAASAGIAAIQELISSARDLAYQALNSASTLAEVTGTVTGLTGATSLSGLGFDPGDTITVSDGTTTATYNHAGGQDVQDFIDAVNNEAGLNVVASLTADGRIQLDATGVNDVTIGGSASAGELLTIGLTAGTTSSTTNALRQALAQEFDTIRQQIDDLAADAGYNGQNLLAGSTLTVTFNEDGTSSVTVTGTAVTAAGLGVDSAVSTGGNLQYDADINSFLSDLDAASASLETQASRYSSNAAIVATRESFARDMGDLLTTGADNLVLADTNAEGARLLALQTHQQLAATALSLASKADTGVLRLFGVA